MDNRDPLGSYRHRFCIPKTERGRDSVYLLGNSLGLQPKSVSGYVEQELSDWATRGVDGYGSADRPWSSYHEFFSQGMSTILGAKPGEVVVMNSLTVNLHLMLVSFYRPTPGRHKILMEASAFPSDLYAVKSQIRFNGLDPRAALVEAQPRPGEQTIRTDDILSILDREGNSIAIILIGGVNYLTGQAFDMETITKAGHQHGCVVGFDLAHAVGNILLDLHDWNVDFAVWCTYKYLNGGPGSIGGCFVHEKHGDGRDLPRFAGWWGHTMETRFQMPPDFDPTGGAEGWQVSNTSVLSAAPLLASLEIFDEVGVQQLRTKSERLTAYLEFLLNRIDSPKFSIITPGNHDQRGCQLSLKIDGDASKVVKDLRREGIACDSRNPNVVRVAPVPLYNRFEDVRAFAAALEQVTQGSE